MRNTDIFDLDFTTPSAVQEMTNEKISSAHLQAALRLAAEAAGELESAIDKDSRDEAAWRLLGSLYIGMDRIKDLNALEDKHQHIFGNTIFTIPQQRRVQRTHTRKLFDVPARITKGVLPNPEEAAAACASPEGAEFDFSRVRGADADGLNELRELFSRLPRDKRPHLLGVEFFMDGLLRAASSPSGTKAMWQVLFEYHRYAGNDAAVRDLMARFRVRFPA